MRTGWIGALLLAAIALSTSCAENYGATAPSSPTTTLSTTDTTPPPTTAPAATTTTQAIVTTVPPEAPSNSLTYVTEEDSVLAVIAAREDTTRFLQLVAALGDDAAFRQERGITVIVPDDTAWDAYGADEFGAVLEDPNAVALLLSQHISIGVFPIDELVATGQLTNALAEELPVIDTSGSVTIAGATVLAADLTADNGVVHLVDTVVGS